MYVILQSNIVFVDFSVLKCFPSKPIKNDRFVIHSKTLEIIRIRGGFEILGVRITEVKYSK